MSGDFEVAAYRCVRWCMCWCVCMCVCVCVCVCVFACVVFLWDIPGMYSSCLMAKAGHGAQTLRHTHMHARTHTHTHTCTEYVCEHTLERFEKVSLHASLYFCTLCVYAECVYTSLYIYDI